MGSSPRSYLVATEKGETLRRNRIDLRASGEHFRFRSNEVPDNVPVVDSISCAGDRAECGNSSAPVSPVSAAFSSTEPTESASSSTAADPSSVQPFRRSSRKIEAPDILNL